MKFYAIALLMAAVSASECVSDKLTAANKKVETLQAEFDKMKEGDSGYEDKQKELK